MRDALGSPAVIAFQQHEDHQGMVMKTDPAKASVMAILEWPVLGAADVHWPLASVPLGKVNGDIRRIPAG
jgi:hypothetical protein